MPKQCKVEIYDRDFAYKSHASIDYPSTSFDYLALEKSSVEIPIIDVDQGDFVHITDMMGNIVYQGIAASPERSKGTITLGVKPLLSLFDITVSFDRTDLSSNSLETFLRNIIAARYVYNADTLERVNMNVTTTSHTLNVALNLKDNVHSLWDIATSSLTGYGVLISAVLDPQNGVINVTIGTSGTATKTLESDLSNCIEPTFTIGDDYGALNKIFLIDKTNESNVVTYYLHTDGTIDVVNIDRITPVFATVEYIETSSDFATEAHARAIEALTPQTYDNCITATFRHDDKLVAVDDFVIGQITEIRHDGAAYTSILTAYDDSEVTKKLTFGYVRTDLTKKLKIQRRS